MAPNSAKGCNIAMGASVLTIASRYVAVWLFCSLPLIVHAQDQKKASPATKPPASAAAPQSQPFPPNEIDLKAAYCRPIVAAATAEHQKAVSADLPPSLSNAAKERLNASIQRTRRLEFYLLPRLNTLQSTGLLEAQARGYTDVASLQELARTCDSKCSGIADAAASTACRQRCGDGSDAAKRAHACDDVSWLPLKDF